MMHPRPRSPEEEQKLVDEWNRRHPVGTSVRRYKYINPNREAEPVLTKTTSAAWVLGGHTAVVMVEGKAGCVALASVIPEEPFKYPPPEITE